MEQNGAEGNEDRLMTICDAALYLQLSPGRIRYEVFLKRMPFLKIGRSVRFKKSDLISWLDTKTQTLGSGKDGVENEL